MNCPLSNVQIELLKLYSTHLSEKDMTELKDQLAKFYTEKSIPRENFQEVLIKPAHS